LVGGLVWVGIVCLLGMVMGGGGREGRGKGGYVLIYERIRLT